MSTWGEMANSAIFVPHSGYGFAKPARHRVSRGEGRGKDDAVSPLDERCFAAYVRRFGLTPPPRVWWAIEALKGGDHRPALALLGGR